MMKHVNNFENQSFFDKKIPSRGSVTQWLRASLVKKGSDVQSAHLAMSQENQLFGLAQAL